MQRKYFGKNMDMEIVVEFSEEFGSINEIWLLHGEAGIIKEAANFFLKAESPLCSTSLIKRRR